MFLTVALGGFAERYTPREVRLCRRMWGVALRRRGDAHNVPGAALPNKSKGKPEPGAQLKYHLLAGGAPEPRSPQAAKPKRIESTFFAKAMFL